MVTNEEQLLLSVTGQGVPFTKLHQPKTLWGMRPRSVPRECLGFVNAAQTLAYVDAKGKRAFHQNADVCR